MFLAVAGLATFGASCSSDDNSDEPVKVQAGQLAVKADKTEIKEGESVKFSVTLDGKEEKGAELSSDGGKISPTHVFKEAGEYNVVAKKKGAKDSAAVKITVVKGEGEAPGEGEVPGEVKTLVLSADLLEVNVGGKVTFKVTDGKDAVKDVVITEVGGKAVANGVWTAAKPGIFKFVATKAGYEKSNEFSVEVLDNSVPEVTPNSVVLGKNKYDLNIGILGIDQYVSGVDADGENIYTTRAYNQDGVVYYIFTYQMFKGTDFEKDYENAFETGGVIFTVKIAIPQDGKGVKTPANSEPKSWLFVGSSVILDGAVLYEKLLNEEIMIGYTATKDTFTVNAEGTFTAPEKTDFNAKFSGPIDGIYTFAVKAPTANNTNSLKQVKANASTSKNFKMIKK